LAIAPRVAGLLATISRTPDKVANAVYGPKDCDKASDALRASSRPHHEIAALRFAEAI